MTHTQVINVDGLVYLILYMGNILSFHFKDGEKETRVIWSYHTTIGESSLALYIAVNHTKAVGQDKTEPAQMVQPARMCATAINTLCPPI